MAPEQYEATVADPKFAEIQVSHEVAYPDGRTGFYAVRLRHSDRRGRDFRG